MKKGISIVGILVLVLFLASSFSLRENPQDAPRGAKKHIKLIKEKNGQKMELDTILEEDQILIWDGDTIGKHIKIDKEDVFSVRLDSLQKTSTIEYAISGKDGKGVHKIVMVKSKEGEPGAFEFKGDSKNNAVWVSVDSDATMPHAAGVLKTIAGPNIKVIKATSGSNVIDLGDPGIISYEKKKMGGGREKIVIIRKEPEEETGGNMLINGLINGSEGDDAVPCTVKTVRIIKNDKSEFQVLEGDSCCISDQNGNQCKVIIKGAKDGEVFHIEEIKESNGKKVKVTVKAEAEKDKE
jgi:hypothetical protein